jgi:hypothetical protein
VKIEISGMPPDDDSEEAIIERIKKVLDDRFVGTPMTPQSLPEAQALVNSIALGRVPVILHISVNHQKIMVCHEDIARRDVDYCRTECEVTDCPHGVPF